MSDWNDRIISEFRANPAYSGFAGYEKKTTRQIPVMLLSASD